MNQPLDSHSIQKNIEDMQKTVSRVLLQLARMSDGHTSGVMRDLTQLSLSLTAIKGSVSSNMQTQERQIGALMGVGNVINSSLGLKRVLSEVMDRLIALMNAERGFLMLKESDGGLHVQVARGMDQEDVTADKFKISNTVVRQVAETGQAILTTNAQNDPRFEQQLSVATYHLLSILCAPLKIKDDLIGVLYVDNRLQSGIFQQSDFELISAFANQAAVAINNAQLFDDLQDSNQELQIAYQATLEGWVRALDLRDKETEGHTKRVTALTQKLARSMGVNESDLVHITRGALLHDIGKMAIPDGILLKPGELTEDERKLIEKHPVYAFEMLRPIKFLLSALEIPHCHHEKWDGSGYPRGLKGEEIPFAARIFAVVDVWDALVSDRPYRKGLIPSDIRDHINKDSGTHFDPQVVNAFLKLEDTMPRPY